MSYSIPQYPTVPAQVLAQLRPAMAVVNDMGPQIEAMLAARRTPSESVNTVLETITPNQIASMLNALDQFELIERNVYTAFQYLGLVPDLVTDAYDRTVNAARILEDVERVVPALTQPEVAEIAEREIAELSAEADISWDPNDGITVRESSRPQIQRVIVDIAACVGEIVTPIDRLIIGFAVVLWIQFRDWEATVIFLYSLHAALAMTGLSDTQSSADPDDPES